MEKRSPQLDAAVPRLESAWAQLIPALPVWRDEAVPANERAGTRALLEQWRPLPPSRPAPLSPWHALRRRFLDPTGFVDRPSPYATAAPPPPISLGLPGDWDPPSARWAQYERWMREMVEGASDLATGRKRPRLRPGMARIRLQQTLWDSVIEDPAWAYTVSPMAVWRRERARLGTPKMAS